MMKRIYLDTAAATPLDPRVRQAMLPYLGRLFGNPSSLHQEGVAAAEAVRKARQQVAAYLGVSAEEIIFTSGGTESNNLALTAGQGGEVLVSAIEHSSILNAAPNAQKIKIKASGLVDLDDLKARLSPETKLVSVMLANNEIGSVQPIKEIAKIIRAYRQAHGTAFPYFHTDACQATRFLDLFIPRLGVDLLTLNGAKIYGPKGIGVLYQKRGVKLKPQIWGGGQEADRRAGTENVPGIVGLAKALEIVARERETEAKRLESRRQFFIALVKKLPPVEVNAPEAPHLPHLVSLMVPQVLAEQLVLELDARGIAVSTGSACALTGHDESYVIMALGRSKKEAQHYVRFSFDRKTTKSDLKKAALALNEIINKYQNFTSS